LARNVQVGSFATLRLAGSPAYVNQFLATSEGLALLRAFSRIPSPSVRRSIVLLVEQITAKEA
jgi:hypothetical protein